jgi:hypothetical protein
MRNLETMDSRIYTVFSKRVELHNARDAAMYPEGHVPQEDSLQGEYGGMGDSMEANLEEPSVERNGGMTGPAGEVWNNPDVPGTYQGPGTGAALANTRAAIPRGFRKGGSTRRKAATKKQKSKKNKRQSRRKVRRSSSRKAGRK